MSKSSIKYAAKLAYQLCLMRGIYTSKQLGAVCHIDFGQRIVSVTDPAGNSHNVAIRKGWAAL